MIIRGMPDILIYMSIRRLPRTQPKLQAAASLQPRIDLRVDDTMSNIVAMIGGKAPLEHRLARSVPGSAQEKFTHI